MQDDLRELFSQYDPSLTDGGKKAHVIELCRLVTVNSQVRDEVVYPWCATRAPKALLDNSTIRMDLARVLVMEIVSARTTDLWYDALVQVLGSLLEALWDEEESDAGLWASVPAVGGAIDLNRRLIDRLEELDCATRQGIWTPLEPAGLETVRNSVPACAIRWAELNPDPPVAETDLR